MNNPEEIWRETILNHDKTIKDAIDVLNNSGMRIVLIVDINGILEGTVSDGDIRRGLLKGLDLKSSITTVIHREAFVVPPHMDSNMVIQLMTANKIQQIPIVDDRQKVIGLHLWDRIISPVSRTNIFVIMAGGKGSRLGTQTENCPKPLLPIAGKPILEHIIMQAKAEGFINFVIAIHYLGYMIEEYFGQGERFGINIEYLREEKALGTAGALSLLHSHPETPIVVTNGDVITDIHYGDMLDFHNHVDAAATMAVRPYELQNPFGVVQIHGIDIIGYEEKPRTISNINAGVYVIEPQFLKLLPNSEPCDMPAFFESIRNSPNRVVAYAVHEQWLDIGNPKDLVSAQKGWNSLEESN